MATNSTHDTHGGPIPYTSYVLHNYHAGFFQPKELHPKRLLNERSLPGNNRGDGAEVPIND